MAATTTDRNTRKQYIQRQVRLSLAPATDIPSGVLVSVVIGTGLAVNAADAVGQRIVGLSCHSASYAAGDRDIIVERGAFWMANDGTITIADVEGMATILDNQTVSKAATTTNDIPAGVIEDVDAQFGVCVRILGGNAAAT